MRRRPPQVIVRSPSDVGGISLLLPTTVPTGPPAGIFESRKSIDAVFKECQPTFMDYVQSEDHSLWTNIQPLIDITYRHAFAQQYGFNPTELDALLEKFREAACHTVSIKYLNDLSAQPNGQVEVTATQAWSRIQTELAGLDAWPCIYRHVRYLVEQRLGRIEEARVSSQEAGLRDVLLTLNQNDIAEAFVEHDTLWESFDNKGEVMYKYDLKTQLYIPRNRIDLQTYLRNTFKSIVIKYYVQLQNDRPLANPQNQKKIDRQIYACEKTLKRIGSPAFIASISHPTAQRITDRSLQNKFKERLNNNRHLFALQGGRVIDTTKVVTHPDGRREMDVRSRTREDCCTFEAPEPYDPDADGSDFREFLLRVMGRNQEAVECLLRLIAYSMTGFTDAHVSPLCLGETRAGKSVFNHIMDRIFGEYYIVADQDIFIKATKSAGSASYYLSELSGKRFAGFVEVDASSEWAVALYKRLIGGDKIKSRKLYADNETNTPTHKLWILCNDLPKGKMDDAMLARIIKIDFKSRFPTEEQDREWGVSPNGIDVYRAEKGYENRYDRVEMRSGALNVILDAMVRWVDSEKDFAIPECFKASKRELAKRQNNVVEWGTLQVEFLNPASEAVLPESHRAREIKSAQLYQIYAWWCKHSDDAGEPVSKEKFYLDFPKFVKAGNRKIEDYYVNDKKGSRYRCLKLTHDTDEVLRQLIDRA